MKISQKSPNWWIRAALPVLFASVCVCLLSVSNANAALATAVLNFDSSAFNSQNTQNGTAYTTGAGLPYSFNQFSGYNSAGLRTVTASGSASSVAATVNGGGTALAFTTAGSGTPGTVGGSSFVLRLVATGNINISGLHFDYLANNNSSGMTVTWSYLIVGGGSGSQTGGGTSLTTGATWNGVNPSFTQFTLTSGQTNRLHGNAEWDNCEPFREREF